MEGLSLIVPIMLIHIFAWFTPGPLFILIIRNSLVYSRKTGLWTAVGIASGNFLHILYSVTGLSILISRSPFIFNLIKLLGICYIFYLGIKTFFHEIKNQKVGSSEHLIDISASSAVKTGFLTNILSPKASLFFASIFTGVFSANGPDWVVIFLMLAMPLNSFFMASILSFFFTQEKVRLVYVKYQFIANKLLGTCLVLFAIIIALSI